MRIKVHSIKNITPLSNKNQIQKLKSMKSYVSRISGFYLNYYMLSQALAFAFIYQSFNEAKWHSEFFRAYCAANSSDAGCASIALKHSTTQINKEVFAIGLLKTLAWNSAGLVCITWAVSVHSCAKLKTILRRSRINRASFSWAKNLRRLFEFNLKCVLIRIYEWILSCRNIKIRYQNTKCSFF